MEADLGSVGALAKLASLLAPEGANVDELMAELAARFCEELDYQHAAGWQCAFAALCARDPRIHVPAIVDSHTRPRVLTTELVRAFPFSELCVRSEAERRAGAELLFAAVLLPIVHGGVFNAAPQTQDFKRHMLTRGANVTRMPQGLTLLNRLRFGFWSQLARLDVDAAGRWQVSGLPALDVPALFRLICRERRSRPLLHRRSLRRAATPHTRRMPWGRQPPPDGPPVLRHIHTQRPGTFVGGRLTTDQ